MNGLCGSAAVDFIASAWLAGLLNSMSRFDLDRLRMAGRLVQLDCHSMNVNTCVIVPGSQFGLNEAIPNLDSDEFPKTMEPL